MFEDVEALWLLFSSSFLGATLLPGGSEITFLYLLHNNGSLLTLILVATIGNTLGGMVNYVIGRLLPNNKPQEKKAQRAAYYLHKYGYLCLLFSWLPIIGDPLCLMAGWLRFNVILSCCLIAIGKCIRYAFLALTLLTIS